MDGKLREMNLGILSRIKRVKTRAGQSMVEFAMIVPLFFLLIFGIIDLGHVFYVQMTLQNALRQAGRFAVTGNHLLDPASNQLSRVLSIKKIAESAAVGLIDPNMPNITIYSIGTNGSVNLGIAGAGGDAGGPGATVVISIGTSLQLFTPLIGQFFGTGGVYTFTNSTSFRNEPFPASQAQ